MMNLKEISFVIQGKLDHNITSLAIQNIRRIFPEAEIVLSTYAGTDTIGLDYDKIALCEDPGSYSYDNHPFAKENNINRQIRTTLTGLRMATRRYAFKLRTDFILTGCGFLDYFNQFLKSDPKYQIFKHKILSCVFFARNPRIKDPLLFHPSDIAFFGLCEDLINLFDVSFITKDDSAYYKKGKYHHCRYTPEQHLWVNCLRKNGKEIKFDHFCDYTKQQVKETEKYVVSNFIYLDWHQFNLMPPEKFKNFDADLDPVNCITHIEWQRLYKQYLDSALDVPKYDYLRRELTDRQYQFKISRDIKRLIECIKIFLRPINVIFKWLEQPVKAVTITIRLIIRLILKLKNSCSGV